MFLKLGQNTGGHSYSLKVRSMFTTSAIGHCCSTMKYRHFMMCASIMLPEIASVQLQSSGLLYHATSSKLAFSMITTIDFLYPRCSLHSILKKLSRESLQKLSQVRQCLFLKPWNGSYLPQSENQIHYNGLHGLTCPNSSLPN